MKSAMIKVVVVDDDQLVRDGLSALIRASADVEVEIATAGSARDAIALTGAIHPDIMFVDIQMPGMSGLELITQLREAYGRIVIIVVSGHAEFQYAQRALQLGVMDYVLKPVSVGGFKKVLRQALDTVQRAGRPASEPPSPHVPTDDDPAQQLIKGGRKLSPIALSVIQYVASHYQGDIKLETTAQSVFVHPSYLSDLFKKETGDTFTSFLNRYRVHQAKALLRQLDCKVYMVASAAGFNDQRYFSRVFKKIVGITPIEYRQLWFKDHAQ